MAYEETHALSEQLIERALDNLGVHYERDDDNELFAPFSLGKDNDPYTGNFYFRIESNDKDVLRVLASTGKRVPQEKWQDAIITCNQYHQHSRFGRSYLMIGSEDIAMLIYEANLLLQTGVSIKFMENFLGSTIGGGINFFNQANSRGLA